MVVGPTKVKPARLSAFESATDPDERVGMSASVRGSGSASGRCDQTRSGRPPSGRSATVARALTTVASILRRLRTIPASSIKRATSVSSKDATASGSKSAKADRKFSRLRRIVTQLSPDWNASRLSRSNRPRSSRTGRPHSWS